MKNNIYNVSPTSHISPVAFSERLSSIDIIRGVALLGIFMINIEIFAQPYEKFDNPLLSNDFSGLNCYFWIVKEFVFSQKMWALFSMLFGAGAFLIITRAEEKGKAAGIADIYYRRLLWLLLFALIHAYLIWSGDVLYFYAIVGLFLYPLRKLTVRGMVIAVSVLLFVSVLISYKDYNENVLLKEKVTKIERLKDSKVELNDEQQATLEKWKSKNSMISPDLETLQKTIETISKGTYIQIIQSEKKWVHFAHTELFYTKAFFGILTMMLLGMALIKSKVLTAELKPKTYLLMMVFGYVIGFSIAMFRTQDLLKHHFDLLAIGGIFSHIERIATALGHIGLICLFCKSNILKWLKTSLASVGRMAFTNYIMQSLIGVFLFYSFGFGLYGSMDRTEQVWVVGAVWLFQLIASTIWLKYFRFGPLEWCWRSLTYWKRQPMFIKQ